MFGLAKLWHFVLRTYLQKKKFWCKGRKWKSNGSCWLDIWLLYRRKPGPTSEGWQRGKGGVGKGGEVCEDCHMVHSREPKKETHHGQSCTDDWRKCFEVPITPDPSSSWFFCSISHPNAMPCQWILSCPVILFFLKIYKKISFPYREWKHHSCCLVHYTPLKHKTREHECQGIDN